MKLRPQCPSSHTHRSKLVLHIIMSGQVFPKLLVIFVRHQGYVHLLMFIACMIYSRGSSKLHIPARGGPVRQPSPTKNIENPIELFSFSEPTKSTWKTQMEKLIILMTDDIWQIMTSLTRPEKTELWLANFDREYRQGFIIK